MLHGLKQIMYIRDHSDVKFRSGSSISVIRFPTSIRTNDTGGASLSINLNKLKKAERGRDFHYPPARYVDARDSVISL